METLYKADQLDELLEGLAKETRRFIDERCLPLEKRITEIEARGIPEYRGIFTPGTAYHKASMCTHEGSLWYARRETLDHPGTSDAWQLVAKRGRDGKDAR